jgi:hypothetical protein
MQIASCQGTYFSDPQKRSGENIDFHDFMSLHVHRRASDNTLLRPKIYSIY